MKNNYYVLAKDSSKKIPLIGKSVLVGGAAGIVVVLYRITLTYAEKFSFFAYDYLREHMKWIPVAIVILAGLGYVIGQLVSNNSMISGSGIPQLEGILKGHFQKRKSWRNTLCSKFLGGTLAIMGGLSLGREGPSIQLGANVAEGIGNKIAESRLERKILMASGASAGLAAAFNAPLAGVIFALEEVFKYFSPIILLSTMSAAVTADFISKQVFGTQPIFRFELVRAIPLENYWLLILLGVFMGIMGSIYNLFLLKVQKLYLRLHFLKANIKTIIPFFFALTAGLFFPIILGGGHRIVEELTIEKGIVFLSVVFLFKLIFSAVSFGSGAPGGIFFPLLVLGASLGGVFAQVLIQYFGYPEELFYNFIILAMAGYFTAIVRAPITGIVLIMEMTGSFESMLQLTIVALVAYVVADLMKSPPIYDALLENLLTKEQKGEEIEGNKIVSNRRVSNKRVIIELIVQHGSLLENNKIMKIAWPTQTLLVSVKRGEMEILPQGDTVIRVGDQLSILTDVNHESIVREYIGRMNDV